MEALKNVYDTVKSLITLDTATNQQEETKETFTMPVDQIECYNALINSGFTVEEAFAAIMISNNTQSHNLVSFDSIYFTLCKNECRIKYAKICKNNQK